MKVTVFGSGYVGLVTGTCLAEFGNDVLCVDIDKNKIAMLNNSEVPIYEPGLDALIHNNAKAGRLKFTTDIEEAVEHGLYQFIAVGTPPDEDGSADMQYVLGVAKSIGQYMNDFKIIIDKSTVPVGTADRVREIVLSALETRGVSVEFDVVSNPEFLKEGSAIQDFMKPDRIIIGTDNPRTEALMKSLYTPSNRNHDKIISMDIRSSELTKYAANAMLATKISFINELANLAEHLGADIEQVRKGIGSDARIGYHFIYPGCGYGGSCFPKDVQALSRAARDVGYKAEMLDAIENVNNRQKHRLFEKIYDHFDGQLQGKVFALWGLSFKPETDDMRDAPSRVLLESLIRAGATVQAYDPEAMKEAARIYKDEPYLKLFDSANAALDNADALCVVTEWKEFWVIDCEHIKSKLSQPVIFDGRNIYDPVSLRNNSFIYYGIGKNA